MPLHLPTGRYSVSGCHHLYSNAPCCLPSTIPADSFVAAAGDLTASTVIEVGAGPGNLTRSILQVTGDNSSQHTRKICICSNALFSVYGSVHVLCVQRRVMLHYFKQCVCPFIAIKIATPPPLPTTNPSYTHRLWAQCTFMCAAEGYAALLQAVRLCLNCH